MTPLIDVLLVLLIIFLVMIPIMLRITPVAMPSMPERTYEPPVIVKVHGDLSISIDGGPAIPSAELAGIRTRALASKSVFVDAESTVPWTEVVSIVDRVHSLDTTIGVAVRIHDPEP